MSTPTKKTPTAAEEGWEAIARIVLGLALAAFEGGWLLMLVLGLVGHQTGDPRWFVGYWTCVPTALALRLLIMALTRSNRKYALPPPPVVRR